MDDADISDISPDAPAAPLTGEALMATTGIQHLFTDKPKRITVADKEAAERLPRDIRRAVRAFLDEDWGAKKIPSRAPFDYMKALDQITEASKLFPAPDDADAEAAADPLQPDPHLAIIADLFRGDDNELAIDYMATAQKIVSYLQSILPIRLETLNVVLGPKNIDPSDTEIARFRRAWNIAQDPMIVLRDMDMGILVSDQVKHLAAMYPQGYALMKSTCATEMGRCLAAKKSWQLSWKKNRLVEVLYQQSVFNSALARDLQTNFKNQGGKPQGGPPPVSNPSKAAAKVQTPTQAIAEGSAS